MVLMGMNWVPVRHRGDRAARRQDSLHSGSGSAVTIAQPSTPTLDSSGAIRPARRNPSTMS
jgi:hypothetical protein